MIGSAFVRDSVFIVVAPIPFFDLAVKLPFSSALSSMESWRICRPRRFMKRNGEAPRLPEMGG